MVLRVRVDQSQDEIFIVTYSRLSRDPSVSVPKGDYGHSKKYICSSDSGSRTVVRKPEHGKGPIENQALYKNSSHHDDSDALKNSHTSSILPLLNHLQFPPRHPYGILYDAQHVRQHAIRRGSQHEQQRRDNRHHGLRQDASHQKRF